MLKLYRHFRSYPAFAFHDSDHRLFGFPCANRKFLGTHAQFIQLFSQCFTRMKNDLRVILILRRGHGMLYLFCSLFTVIVSDLNHFYTRDFQPNVFSIFISGDGHLMWYKNQPIRLVEVASPLSLAIPCELVIMTGQMSNILKGMCIPQIS